MRDRNFEDKLSFSQQSELGKFQYLLQRLLRLQQIGRIDTIRATVDGTTVSMLEYRYRRVWSRRITLQLALDELNGKLRVVKSSAGETPCYVSGATFSQTLGDINDAIQLVEMAIRGEDFTVYENLEKVAVDY